MSFCGAEVEHEEEDYEEDVLMNLDDYKEFVQTVTSQESQNESCLV